MGGTGMAEKAVSPGPARGSAACAGVGSACAHGEGRAGRRTPGPGWGWGWPRPQPLTPRSCLLLSPGAFAPPPHCAGGGPGARLTKRPPWGCVLLLVRGPVLVGPPPPRRHRLVPSTSGHFSPRPGGRRPLSRAGTFLVQPRSTASPRAASSALPGPSLARATCATCPSTAVTFSQDPSSFLCP